MHTLRWTVFSSTTSSASLLITHVWVRSCKPTTARSLRRSSTAMSLVSIRLATLRLSSWILQASRSGQHGVSTRPARLPTRDPPFTFVSRTSGALNNFFSEQTAAEQQLRALRSYQQSALLTIKKTLGFLGFRRQPQAARFSQS